MTPLATNKQTKIPSYQTHATSKVKAEQEYVDTKVFVVHGIPCQRPMVDTIQYAKKIGMRVLLLGHIGLEGQKRVGKTTSSADCKGAASGPRHDLGPNAGRLNKKTLPCVLHEIAWTLLGCGRLGRGLR